MADISTELQAINDAKFGREVRYSIYQAISKINEVVDDVDSNLMRFRIPTGHGAEKAAEYDYKVANMTTTGAYDVYPTFGYTDTPDTSKSWCIYTLRCQSNRMVQLAFERSGVKWFWREGDTSGNLTAWSGYDTTMDYKIKTGEDETKATEFDHKIVNISETGSYFIAATQNYTDTPDASLNWALTVFPISDIYYVQVVCNAPTNTLYWRFCQSGEAKNGWVRLLQSNYAGKKVAIYGDSVSTYVGYNPEGNRVRYDGTNLGVTDVKQTWWMRAILRLDMSLVMNNSWAGRAASIKCAQTSDRPGAGYKQANVDVIGSNGTPDVIIVKLGTNDYLFNAAIGTYNGTQEIPTTVDADEDMDTFREAYGLMLHRIRSTYPNAELWCCTITAAGSYNGGVLPAKNTAGFAIAEYNRAIKELAAAFNAKVIDHATCGINQYNLSTVLGDNVHPNATGMNMIAQDTVRTMIGGA